MFTPTNLTRPQKVRIHPFPSADVAPVIAVKGNSLLAFTNPVNDRTCLLRNEDEGDGEAYADFEREHCQSCDYYFDTRTEEGVDVDGNDYTTTTTSCCPAHRASVSEVFSDRATCPAGHEEPSADSENESVPFDLPQLLIEYGIKPAAYLANAGMIHWEWDEEFKTLDACTPGGMLNVHGNDYGKICWGENEFPRSFAAAVHTFVNSEFNDDLMSFDEFTEQAEYIEDEECEKFPATLLRTPSSSADAALFMDPEIQADEGRLHLLASGIPADVVIPLLRHQAHDINGYITPPLPACADRCWFISHDGYLLGQLPVPSPSAPCPTPLPC